MVKGMNEEMLDMIYQERMTSVSYHEKLLYDGYEVRDFLEDPRELMTHYRTLVKRGEITNYLVVPVSLVPEIVPESGPKNTIEEIFVFYVKPSAD